MKCPYCHNGYLENDGQWYPCPDCEGSGINQDLERELQQQAADDLALELYFEQQIGE